VIQVDPAGSQWAVGTWGEGAWILSSGRLRPLSLQGGYITAVTWTDPGPVWGTLDGELVMAEGGLSLGPLDGLPGGGVSSLVSWEGRWIWGTTGQGLGWWTEYENPSLLR
jgi:hypothetical protein